METLPICTYDGLRIELSKAVLTLHQVRRGAIHCSGVGKELCKLFVEEIVHCSNKGSLRGDIVPWLNLRSVIINMIIRKLQTKT